jgi:acyl carrier protein
MTPTELKLIDILKDGLKLRMDIALIQPETVIFGKHGLGLDSVDVLEIAVLVDKHFGVQLQDQNDEVRTALTNIASLATYIDRHGPAGVQA